MVNRLLGFIEDDEVRREWEQMIQSALGETELTILTNLYYDEDVNKHILQLSTYSDGELYAGEVAIPELSSKEAEFVEVQLNEIVRSMIETVKSESEAWPKDNYCPMCSRGWNNGEVNADCPHNFPEEYAEKMD